MEGQSAPTTGDGARPPLLVIVGPTASGKTALAIEVARRVDGEIVSADSRYIYRGMDIGTAKPTAAERAGVPHHLIDVVSPDEEYSLARYQADAVVAIEGIWSRGRLPMLVGGTGLYVRAVTRGFLIPRGEPDRERRSELEHLARNDGANAVHALLRRLDSDAAESIDPRNVRRVIRAIEVCEQTGRPFSAQQEVVPPPWRILQIGLTLPREELYARIDRRNAAMIDKGWPDEVRHLLARGYREDLPAMTSLGYGEIARSVRGEIDLAEAVSRINFQGHRYVRQQYTWFRREGDALTWLESDTTAADRVVALVRDRLNWRGGETTDEAARHRRGG